jgi:hypothetical protein
MNRGEQQPGKVPEHRDQVADNETLPAFCRKGDATCRRAGFTSRWTELVKTSRYISALVECLGPLIPPTAGLALRHFAVWLNP